MRIIYTLQTSWTSKMLRDNRSSTYFSVRSISTHMSFSPFNLQYVRVVTKRRIDKKLSGIRLENLYPKNKAVESKLLDVVVRMAIGVLQNFCQFAVQTLNSHQNRTLNSHLGSVDLKLYYYKSTYNRQNLHLEFRLPRCISPKAWL